MRVAHAKGFWAFYLPLDVTLAFSAIYEIIEWGAARVFGGNWVLHIMEHREMCEMLKKTCSGQPLVPLYA